MSGFTTKYEAFVYLWRDSNNNKFYLGYHKGTTDDNYAHSSTVMESFSMNSVPNGFRRKILATGTHDEMRSLEIKLLTNRKESGRWGKYHNIMTSTFPYMWDDPEFREMMASIHEDPEFRKKQSESMSARNKEFWADPAYCKKQSESMSARNKEFWADPAYRKKMSEMMSVRSKGWWKDPELRVRLTEARRVVWEDPEYCKKQSEISTARANELWKDPEYCKKQSESMSARNKEFWADPAYRRMKSEHMSVQNKERWTDPEYRKNLSEKRKALWKDPEYRKNIRGTCSGCGHESTKSNIARFHNERCKHKSL